MKDRARELYDFLHTFAREECIPPTSMIVAGWSLGAVFILALLAHAPLFVTEDKDSLLTKYIRHLVVYGKPSNMRLQKVWRSLTICPDPPYHCLGYAPPPSYYNPVTHDSVNGAKLFPAWVSGYYAHGSSPSALEFHVPLETPPPSVLGMSTDDLESALYNAPAVPGGSDYTLVHAGVDHGLWATIRKAALYPPAAAPDGAVRSSWDEVELRYIWCEQSDWEIPWGAWAFQAEMEEAKAYGRRMRRVSVARLASANHFVSAPAWVEVPRAYGEAFIQLHWDQPQRALDALVSCDSQQARTHL